MTTIVTRSSKGSALTHTELDDNFINLNTDSIQSAVGTTGITASVTGNVINISSNAAGDAAFNTVTAVEFVGAVNGASQFDAKADVNITAGEVVYISGIAGNTPTVGLARSNSSTTMPAFGLAAANITATATGKIIIGGELTGLDAVDFGETSIVFALGDTVYISAAQAGKLTNVKPSGEANQIQNIGKIERATPTTNMSIMVAGADGSAATPALNNGNIFIGDANNNSTTAPFAVSLDATPQLGGNIDTAGFTVSSSTGSVDIRDTASIGPTGLQFTVGAQGQIATNTNVGTWAGNIYNADATGSGLKIQAGQTGVGTPFAVETAGGSLLFSVAANGVAAFNSAYTLPSADGSANQVLTTDGAGAVTFATPAAGGGGVTSIIAGTGISVDSATGNVTVTATGGGASTGNIVFTDYNMASDTYPGATTTRPNPYAIEIGSGAFGNTFTGDVTNSWQNASTMVVNNLQIDEATNGGTRNVGLGVATYVNNISSPGNNTRTFGHTTTLVVEGNTSNTRYTRLIAHAVKAQAGNGETSNADVGAIAALYAHTAGGTRNDGGVNTISSAYGIVSGHVDGDDDVDTWIGLGFDTYLSDDTLSNYNFFACIHNQDNGVGQRANTSAGMSTGLSNYWFIRNEDLRAYSDLGVVRNVYERRNSYSSSSGAISINFTSSPTSKIDVTEDITSVSFTSVVTNNRLGSSFTATHSMLFRDDGNGRTITFPTGAGYYYSNGVNSITLPASGHAWVMVTADDTTPNFYISISPAFATV